jgi:hypothetical protein
MSDPNQDTARPQNCYTVSWPERLKEVQRYGLLLGALRCVSWQVEPELKARIESVLKEVQMTECSLCHEEFEDAKMVITGSQSLCPKCKGPYQGWRYFHCIDCEHRWKLPTRDYRSPSGDNCPRCHAWTFPHNAEPDPSLPVDDMGNLI